MSLLQDIHAWSLGLKPCLRDALRRLLHTPTLTATDYDDLFALLKLEADIADPHSRVPKPLEESHLPSTAKPGSSLRLLSLHSLKHVNRIAEGQKIEFAPSGLTVIYGDNGTGKSGYSRVLKRACRARGEKSDILPNAVLPKEQHGTPQATIVFESGGKKTKFPWQSGSPEHPEMSAVSVFDSHCARAYVDAEQDVAYIPYGLDLVENLANAVLPELTRKLKDELAACEVDLSHFPELVGPTKVGDLIGQLSADTDRTLVETLATLTSDEVTEHASLNATLKARDPKHRSRELQRRVERLQALRQRIEAAERQVDGDTLSSLKERARAKDSAQIAEQLAASSFRSGEELLPGTGGYEWQLLFEAAKRFARLAYPGVPFPPSRDLQCPLCQQQLEEGAGRLQRFEDFVRNDTATLAREKRAIYEGAITQIKNAIVDVGLDATLAGEVTQHDAALCSDIRLFETGIESRRRWMIAAAAANDWSGEPSLGRDPRAALDALINTLALEATRLAEVANHEGRQQAQSKYDELELRRRLGMRKDAVLAAIDKRVRHRALSTCLETLKPQAVSNKSKELAQNYVTESLSTALQKEFTALNITHLKPKLKSRVKDGRTLHKIVLDVPSNMKLADILSEGELRVMAIASFLAELSVSGHDGGAVFDDPVSSLDHFRRLSIANRLAEESKARQVIIFTHDTVFLAEMRSIVERDKLAARFYHLEWMNSEFAGYCNSGLPWQHQSFDDRIDSLEKEQRALQRDWAVPPGGQLNDRMRNAYSHLRATLERAVESIFLNNVVRRFENYIPVKQLDNLKPLLATELSEMHRIFKVASDVTGAHDPATGRNVPVPDPTALDQDIKALKSLVAAFRARK